MTDLANRSALLPMVVACAILVAMLGCVDLNKPGACVADPAPAGCSAADAETEAFGADSTEDPIADAVSDSAEDAPTIDVADAEDVGSIDSSGETPDAVAEAGGDSAAVDTGVGTDTFAPDTCVCSPGLTRSVGGCAIGDIGTQTCTPSCIWGATVCAPKPGWRVIADPSSAFLGRANHTAVWTGTAMIVFGGRTTSGLTNTASSYDYAADKWTAITTPTLFSLGREGHRAVWTGSKMVVWGGRDELDYKKNGSMYEPATDNWVDIDSGSTLEARWYHAQVWCPATGQIFVWGGVGCGTTYCSDGALFNPATNTWSSIAAAPISGRGRPHVVWNGTEAIVWGGTNASGKLKDGARYNPSTNTWTKLLDVPTGFDGRVTAVAAWSGSQFLVWGGEGPSGPLDTGGRLTITSGWTTMTAPGSSLVTPQRIDAAGWFMGGKLYVWSGVGADLVTPLPGGTIYDAGSNAWTAMDSAGAPPARFGATTVLAVKGAIVWGGFTGMDKYTQTGAVFVP